MEYRLPNFSAGYIVGVETDQATLHVSSSAKKPPFMFGKWLLNEQKKQRVSTGHLPPNTSTRTQYCGTPHMTMKLTWHIF